MTALFDSILTVRRRRDYCRQPLRSLRTASWIRGGYCRVFGSLRVATLFRADDPALLSIASVPTKRMPPESEINGILCSTIQMLPFGIVMGSHFDGGVIGESLTANNLHQPVPPETLALSCLRDLPAAGAAGSRTRSDPRALSAPVRDAKPGYRIGPVKPSLRTATECVRCRIPLPDKRNNPN